jgi:hypothetical protein
MKSNVYVRKPGTVDDLKVSISEEIATVPQEMLVGRHLSDIIFRNSVINVSNQNWIYYRLFWCWHNFFILKINEVTIIWKKTCVLFAPPCAKTDFFTVNTALFTIFVQHSDQFGRSNPVVLMSPSADDIAAGALFPKFCRSSSKPSRIVTGRVRGEEAKGSWNFVLSVHSYSAICLMCADLHIICLPNVGYLGTKYVLLQECWMLNVECWMCSCDDWPCFEIVCT